MNKNIIRSFAVLLVALILFSQASCTKNNIEEESKNTETQEYIEGDRYSNSESPFGNEYTPVPLNTKVDIGSNWHVNILEILDNTQSVLKESSKQANEGYRVIAAKIGFSYIGKNTGSPASDLNFIYKGSNGKFYKHSLEWTANSNSLEDITGQYPGVTEVGFVFWHLPIDAVNDGKIIIETADNNDYSFMFFEGIPVFENK